MILGDLDVLPVDVFFNDMTFSEEGEVFPDPGLVFESYRL